VPNIVHRALSDSFSDNGDNRGDSASPNTVAGVLDAGEAAASAGEDRFATRRDGAEDGAGGTGMCFKDDDGNDSTPASESDDKEATDENGGAREERDGEHEENDDDD